ncbi:MAG: phosphoribosylformylglycinamidine synthase subunit PurL [Leptospirales bacterium]|nr:phosphoribosylformylglycinamidine synthase subunit PurL [Leptospirales bacterium]
MYSEKEITEQDAIEHGLSAEEFARIREFLGGRRPTATELGMYSGLWSEHCSYKNSILQLKTLPTESPRSLTRTGEENAGALDIGDGLAVVFKIESHNHPTAVEPYQGAATGVGGIMRDIFTMGARPICSLNSLRFGPPDQARNRHLLTHAVKGIGDYGNSLGIPVLGGELFFDPSFSRNCLVNAMTVGIVAHDAMAFARASGEGNPVFIVGGATGRDGIHGASFASRDLSAESESKRSAVQVGDPFMEKLLMEATLELIASKTLVGIQDMGAAGLSCATTEMSAKGRAGMSINLDLVPLREAGMNAYEIMLSESQERMLVVVERGKEQSVKSIFKRWELSAVEIGHVTNDGIVRLYRDGRLCAAVPADSLVLGGGAPRYVREQRRPEYLDQLRNFQDEDLPQHPDLGAAFLDLLGAFNVCSRRPLYEQYDTEVGLVRAIGPGGDGGLARVPGSNKAIAVSADCNSRYCYLDPALGAAQATAESARNVAVTGAVPIGVTNNLNFGNPYSPENYYVFAECVRGLREACLAFGIPVTGGNVSFYNESDDGPVYPTPTIGMVGLLEDVALCIKPHIAGPGRAIFLAGEFRPSFGGSEYQSRQLNLCAGAPPALDLGDEKRLCEFLAAGARSGLIASAHDLSLGGLAVGLFRFIYDSEQRSCPGVRLDPAALEVLAARCSAERDDLLLFGESNGCALISPPPGQEAALLALAAECSISLELLGASTGEGLLDLGRCRVAVGAALDRYEAGLVGVFGAPQSDL